MTLQKKNRRGLAPSLEVHLDRIIKVLWQQDASKGMQHNTSFYLFFVCKFGQYILLIQHSNNNFAVAYIYAKSSPHKPIKQNNPILFTRENPQIYWAPQLSFSYTKKIYFFYLQQPSCSIPSFVFFSNKTHYSNIPNYYCTACL